MDQNSYGLIEMSLVFGIALALALWELRRINRLTRRHRDPSSPDADDDVTDSADEHSRGKP